MSGGARLPELHLEILKLVWSEWDSPKTGRIVDGGLTRDEIFEGLQGKYQSNWRPPKPKPGELASLAVLPSSPPLVNKSVTLKRHLQQLCENEPQYLTIGKVTDRRGSPFVYKINDLRVATWPSTAFILTEVWKAKHLEKRLLLQAMLHQRNVAFIPDQSATQDEVEAEIEKQVNWCLAQHYLEFVEQHMSEFRPAPRLHYEHKLLEFIARSGRLGD
jgi:hypothetical protein